ncbi:MAG: hypothetical protein EOO59_09055 [Hymenobacter sp.]|nr:MAG: hypothetical protein EOO59_09055 [Hymenobacter sp.]
MLPTNPLLNATAPAGPHLPAATLRQYAAGTLAPAARHRVEAHTLACPRCADILEGLFQTPAATTDQALAQLQQRLRRRVQQAESARPAAGRTKPAHRWVVPQLAAAAALLFGLVAGGWWTWQQRHPGPIAVATAPAAQSSRATLSAAEVAPAPAAALVSPTTSINSRHLIHASKPAARQHKLTLQHNSSSKAVAKLVPTRAPVAQPPTVEEALANAVSDSRPTTYQPPAVLAPTAALTPPDSTTLSGRAAGVALSRLAAPAALVRDRAMPAVAPIAPAPVGGYASWREKIRHEAAEFKPEDPAQPVSGSVQLRLLIGADGKIQEVKVLHGLRDDYDAEAQRLVCDGPGWVPGIGGGKRAAQAVDVAVPFQ